MKNLFKIKNCLIIILINCFLFPGSSFAQKLDSINNNTIMYGFKYVGSTMNWDTQIGTASKIIVTIELTEVTRDSIKKISKKEWIKLLNNDRTDWTANLLLYYLYKKDAIEFYKIIKNRYYWINLLKKKEDLKYWTKHLPMNGYK
jgi:hypothetical protein